MAAARLGALLVGGVLTVVAGQVELVEVEQGVAPVHLELAQLHRERVLVGGDIGLVERVVQRRSAQARQAGPHALERKVLDAAVVVVQADEFTRCGDRQVTDGTKSLVHGSAA